MSYLIVFEIFTIRNENNNKNYQNFKKLIFKFLHLIPLIITKILWSYYVNKNQLSRPFEDIITNLDRLKLLPQMISSVMQHFFENVLFILPLIIIILKFSLFSKKSKNFELIPNFSLFLFTFLTSIGIITLTLIAYVLVFSDYELANAASFSRYISPVTFILWTSCLIASLNYINNFNYKIIHKSSIL